MRARRVFLAAALSFAASTDLALANSDLSDFFPSSRSRAMGGVGVASPEGTDTLFFNPAALAGVKTSVLELVNLQAEGSSAMLTNYAADATAFQQVTGNPPNLAALNTLMGQNAYGRAQDTLTYIGQNFGISLISDVELGALAQNAVYPNIEALYQVTNGIQAGFGFTVWRPKKSKSELRIGGAVKMLFRRGGYQTLSLSDLLSVGPNTTLTQYFGNFGAGYGADLGVQYYIPFRRRFSLTLGAAATDIGDTAFSGGGDMIRQNLSVGASLSYDLGGLAGTFEYDYRDIATITDWRKRNHLGLELKLPLCDLYTGMNEGYLSYGAAADLWAIRVSVVNYTTELGPLLFQEPENRWAAQVLLKF